MKKIILLSFIIFALPLSIVHAHESDTNGETVIHMTSKGFEPREITISSGNKVIFENSDAKPHWPASNIHPTHRAYPNSDIKDCDTPLEQLMFDACRGIQPGGTYSFKFENEGEWRFHDHLNAAFSGKISVGPSDSVDEDIIESPKKEGFFRRVWKSIKSFFMSFFVEDNDDDDKIVNAEDEESIILDLEYGVEDREFDSDIDITEEGITTDDDKLFSYVKKYGAQQSLAQLFSLESKYGNCHDNAHDVGRFSYELHDSDAFKYCAMQCQSGCYHGAVEAYFRANGTKNFESNIAKLCTNDLNPFITHQCVHGVGHGMMAWTDYALFEALDNCDLLPASQGSCYSGVFMENIVQSMVGFSGIEGHTTQYLSDDPHYPCNIVEDKYKPMCYFLQTDRMVQLFGSDFSKVAASCAEVENDHNKRMCFESMGRTVGGHNRNNPPGAIAACSTAPQGVDRHACLMGAVQDTFWDSSGQDNAITFCRLIVDEEEKSVCYNMIFSRAPQVLASSSDIRKFCDKADEDYKTKCLEYID